MEPSFSSPLPVYLSIIPEPSRICDLERGARFFVPSFLFCPPPSSYSSAARAPRGKGLYRLFGVGGYKWQKPQNVELTHGICRFLRVRGKGPLFGEGLLFRSGLSFGLRDYHGGGLGEGL